MESGSSRASTSPKGHDGDSLENLLIKIRQQFPGKSFQGLEHLWDGQALPVKRIRVWTWCPETSQMIDFVLESMRNKIKVCVKFL